MVKYAIIDSLNKERYNNMNQNVLNIVSAKTGVEEKYIKVVLEMVEEGSTIPFMARYRKEKTNNLDVLSKTIIIREVIGDQNEKKLVYKDKKYDENGNILSSTKYSCPVINVEKMYDFLTAIGYKEIFNYLDGEWTLDFAIEKIKQNSRIYSRKQMTWFKRNPDIQWFHPDQKEEIMNYINDQLS